MILGVGSLNAQNALGEVIGEVIDKGGAGVWDVHVYIDDVFGQRYQAKSDEDGRFRISGIPVGEYSLNVKQMGDTLKESLLMCLEMDFTIADRLHSLVELHKFLMTS